LDKVVTELERSSTESADNRTGFITGVTAFRRRSVWKTIVLTSCLTVLGVGLLSGTAFYFYWQHLKSSPQYSLALLVDAAKHDYQESVDELVDSDAVVDDFMPQIAIKAVELYGRGLPPDILQRVARIAAPVMPAVKQRVRDEIPGAIRQRTAGFGNVPFVAMVLGAEQYLDIKVTGDSATVRSKLPEHGFEVRMKYVGDRWKISGLQDEELATRIAQRIGQEIVAIAVNGGDPGRSKIGAKSINELLREAEEIFK